MKIKKIFQSLIFIFLLIGILFPVNAFTYQGQDPNLGNVVIDIQSGPKNYFTELFGIITTTPTVVKPGETITINAGLEVPRYFDRDSSFLYINVPALFEKTFKPLPCSSYQTCLVKTTFTVPSTIKPGQYVISFSAADKAGIIDRASQSFSVSQDSLQCPSSVWGPYVDFVRTSDGNGQIQRSTRNIYDSQCKFVDLASQTFTKCDSGFYITGQATSVTQSSGTKTCTIIPGSNAQPGCGNGIIDTGEYCDVNNVGVSCNDFGYSGGNLKCKSTCQDFDVSSCTGVTLPRLGTKEAGERCYDNNECKSLLCEGNFLKIIPGFCKDLRDLQQVQNNTQIVLHKGIQPDQVKSSTTQDLIFSSCTKSKQCESGSTCNSLNWYIQNNYLTKEDAQTQIGKARVAIDTAFATAGGIGAVVAAGSSSIALGGLCVAAIIGTPIASAICFGAVALAGGVIGGIAGDYISDLVSATANQDINEFGYCTITKTGTNFFDTPLFLIGNFQVTGLYLILGIIGLFLLMSLSRRN